MKKTIVNKCKKIKVVLTDVDGTLTDGSRYYDEKGEHLKKFHVRDGMGVNILLRNGIKTVIVTKEKSMIVKKWASSMNVSQTMMNIKNKEKILPKICFKYKVKPEEIAFIGDDVNDICLLKLVGLSACPNDSEDLVKNMVDFICIKNGGRGSFRELSSLILSNKFPQITNWY